jgi:hypothetical protein
MSGDTRSRRQHDRDLTGWKKLSRPFLKDASNSRTERKSSMDKDMEMLSVLGKIAAALSRSAGHTVEVYKAEESTPPFRVYLTTTEEGDHAIVLVHGTKVTVLPLAKEEPEGLLWHIEVVRKEIAPLEIEVVPFKEKKS